MGSETRPRLTPLVTMVTACNRCPRPLRCLRRSAADSGWAMCLRRPIPRVRLPELPIAELRADNCRPCPSTIEWSPIDILDINDTELGIAEDNSMTSRLTLGSTFIFYRKKPPCMGPESVPIAHSSLPVRAQLLLSLTGCDPCRVVSCTCVEVALKTSSTLFSTEELRTRQVRVKAPQRSFLLHHKSADRANLATFRGISTERSVVPGPSSEASSILGLLLASVRVTASLQA